MVVPCQICENTDFSVWDRKNDIDIIVCANCGFGRADMPDGAWENVEEIYGGDYHERRGYRGDFPRRIRRASRWVKHLTQLRKPGVMLDIGCSLGYSLTAARKLGWEAHGTDISPNAVDACNELGFRSFLSQHPRDFPEWLPPLDGLVMSAVLEHLPDPQDYLNALREKMAPGGVGYFMVPDFSSIRKRGQEVFYIGPPNHVWFWRRENLEAMFAQCGWKVVHPPLVRPRVVGPRIYEYISELLLNAPREALRPWLSDNGYLTNLHLYARAPE